MSQEKPTTQTAEHPQEGSGRQWLLLADVDRIKDYIFASVRLRQMVGASASLAYVHKDLTKDIVSNKRRGTLIFSEGGVTQALFDDKGKAEAAKRELERVYPKETGGATVTVVVQKVEDNFPKALQEGLRTLRQKKMMGGEDETAPSLVASPFFRFCAQTGWQPAEVWEKRTPMEETPEEFSRMSWRQHDWRPPSNWRLSKKTRDRLPIDREVREVLAEKLNCSPCDLEFPQDFDDLGELAQPSGYMAFMEADGNRFGELLSALAQQNASESDYETFSAGLSEITRRTLLFAIRDTIGEWMKGKDERPIPLRVLILGGDDVLLVTIPQVALKMAHLFCRKFQELGEQFKQNGLPECPLSPALTLPALSTTDDALKKLPPFTMSAGIVIAHHNLPILSFRRLADKLLKNAKRRSWKAKKGKVDAGALDFQVITGSGVEDLKVMREEGYEINGKPKRWLTGRPYLIAPDNDEFNELLCAVQKLKNLARRQRHAVVQCLRESSYEQATIGFLRWLCRLKDEQRDAVREVVNLFRSAGDAMVLPWQLDKRPGGYGEGVWTPLIDAVEILELLGQGA